MQIKYFNDTDTLLIDFNERDIVETREINENLLLDLDKHGDIVSMTIEHAKSNVNIFDLNFHQVPASI